MRSGHGKPQGRRPGERADKALKNFRPVHPVPEPLLASGDDLMDSWGYFARRKKSGALLLDSLRPDAVMTLMQRVGLVDHLLALGFSDLRLEIDRDEARSSHLRVYYRETTPDHLLIYLRLSRSSFVPDRRFFDRRERPPVLDMALIEWLSAEDPRKDFSDGRPQLPGQLRPGLGSLRYLMDLIYVAGEILMVDGFLDVPNHFHGAVMYAQTFKFFDPVQEAVLKAILRDLRAYTLVDLSWGMITGSIVDSATGRPQLYTPSEQVYPISPRLKGYFTSARYRRIFARNFKGREYRLDQESMLKRKRVILEEKKIEDL